MLITPIFWWIEEMRTNKNGFWLACAGIIECKINEQIPEFLSANLQSLVFRKGLYIIVLLFFLHLEILSEHKDDGEIVLWVFLSGFQLCEARKEES